LLEIQSICNPRNLISHTKVFDSEKPVSVLIDVCAATDQGECGGMGYGYGGLAWERAYTSNNKYMCWEDSSWPCDDVGSYYCPYWGYVSWATWQRAKHTAFLHKGLAIPDCTSGTCNHVNFTVLKPSDWKQGHVISIKVDGKGLDPGSLMYLKLVTDTHGSSSYQVFHSFYEEMKSEFSISTEAKNLFLSLAESIAQTVSFCIMFVGEPTCETIGLGKQRNWTHRRLLIWLLSQNTGKVFGS
jgi:hypothetical protein